MMHIIRYTSSSGTVALGLLQNGQLIGGFPPNVDLHHLLRGSADELRAQIEQIEQVEQSTQPGRTTHAVSSLLAPIDGETEVWAAGVTYKRSEEARKEESGTPDLYARVSSAKRPELFFKANPRRVAGPDAAISIRADSSWDVPEPELVLVINASAQIIGYTIGNDVSSRSIEGENPLYLPQAKIYTNCCALGPAITPAWEIADPNNLAIGLVIERDGQVYWQGESSTSELKRRFEELVSYLFLENDFPDGVILCTGTALVPEKPFTLQPGDIVQITIDQLGTLRNPVVRGKRRST
jgi:2-dehydro-3-deoxy-D-arabinonate dehydratase